MTTSLSIGGWGDREDMWGGYGRERRSSSSLVAPSIWQERIHPFLTHLVGAQSLTGRRSAPTAPFSARLPVQLLPSSVRVSSVCVCVYVLCCGEKHFNIDDDNILSFPITNSLNNWIDSRRALFRSLAIVRSLSSVYRVHQKNQIGNQQSLDWIRKGRRAIDFPTFLLSPKNYQPIE